MEIQIAALDSENEVKPSTPNSDGFPDFAIRMLMTLSLGVFQRHHREKILDSILQKCLTSRHVSKRPSIAVYTALMARLMEVPNASSTLATDPAALWDLANVFGEDGVVTDTKDIYAFEELVKQTLRHLISTKDQDRSRKYLKSFHERLAGYLAQDSSNMEKCGTPHLVKASLALFWIHRENLSKPLTEEEITRLRRLHLNHLISDLKELDTTPTGLANPSSQLDLLATLDGMIEYQDLLTSDERKPGSESEHVVILSAIC